MDNSWEHQHPTNLNLEQEYAFDPDYIGFPSNWRTPAQSQQFQPPFHQPTFFNSIDAQARGFQHSQQAFEQRGVETTRIPPGNSYLQTSPTEHSQSGYPVRYGSHSGPLQTSLTTPAYPADVHTQSRQYASGSQQAPNFNSQDIKRLTISDDK
jgi:hypothetical protein